MSPSPVCQKLASILLLSTLAAASGCGSSTSTASVEGMVSVDGDPVPEGTVTFYPVAGGRPATGVIQPDGSYQLSYLKRNDGAPLGQHDVTIEARRTINAPEGPKTFAEELAGVGQPNSTTRRVSFKWLAPERYASRDSSGLKATVEHKKNVIDFELNGAP